MTIEYYYLLRCFKKHKICHLLIEKIVFRVQFLLDGIVWNTAEYELGEEILLPKAPGKQAEEGYIYTFIGWGDVPSTASGDERELTFEAQFFKSRLDIDYTTGNNNNVLLGVVLPCVGGGMLLIAGGLITWRIRRKKRCANATATAKTPEADTQQTQ